VLLLTLGGAISKKKEKGVKMSKKDDALMLAMKQLQKLVDAFMPKEYWNHTELFDETNKTYMICKDALTKEEENELHTRSR